MSQHNLPTDKEVQEIRAVLEGVDFPPGIVSWKFEVGEDWTGDPAVKIWLFVDEEVVQLKDVAGVMIAAQQKIHDALITTGIRRWPYVYVRTEAEEKALGNASP
jgi:hypothetical protein